MRQLANGQIGTKASIVMFLCIPFGIFFSLAPARLSRSYRITIRQERGKKSELSFNQTATLPHTGSAVGRLMELITF